MGSRFSPSAAYGRLLSLQRDYSQKKFGIRNLDARGGGHGEEMLSYPRRDARLPAPLCSVG